MGDYKTNQLMYWGASKITDHNRSELEIGTERIERKMRMSNGKMRKYVVTQKKTFTCSWTNLPSTNALAGSGTVDGGISGADMEAFNSANNGSFTLTLRDGATAQTTFQVFISEFSKTIVKRGSVVDLWNLTVTLEEV